MYNVPMVEVSDDFERCWQVAGLHLQKQAGKKIRWFRDHLDPPLLEHLSFIFGNQLFFIQLRDVNHHLDIPGTLEGFLSLTNSCQGNPCVMPMRKTLGEWAPAEKGWGLLNARTWRSVNPPDIISDDQIEMSDWEIQDFAVQVVRNRIEKDGHTLMSWQSYPHIDPSIWFEGPEGPAWVVVRAVRYPLKKAEKPDNLPELQKSCSAVGSIGNFASVLFTSWHDPFDALAEQNGNIAPLYRGEKINTQYKGLQRLAFS